MPGNVRTSLSQLCYSPCFKVGYWLAAAGVFLQGALQDYGRRVFCFSFFLIFFTFQTNFAFYLYCLRSQIYWQAIARASWQQPKKLLGPRKLFSSRGYCPTSCKPAAGDQSASTRRGTSPLREGSARFHPASSQASRNYAHAMAWVAFGEKGRSGVQHT